jgi:Ca2+-binding RTX toxin-like protein
MALIKATKATKLADIIRGSVTTNDGGTTLLPPKGSYVYDHIKNGNDTINGGDGNDIIMGDRASSDIGEVYGVDKLYGGAGNDIIFVNTGYLKGKIADDSKFWLTQSPVFLDYKVHEQAHGGSGNDRLYGSGSIDFLYGDSGNDTLKGYGGDDTLEGGSGKDKIYGGDGSDTIHGGKGNDTLYSGGKGLNSAGYMFGEDGNDTLSGTGFMDGGAGKDKIYLTDKLGQPGQLPQVSNYEEGIDKVYLQKSTYSELGNKVDAEEFVVGKVALEADDHLLYFEGDLYYDADGDGAGYASYVASFSDYFFGEHSWAVLSAGEFVLY